MDRKQYLDEMQKQLLAAREQIVGDSLQMKRDALADPDSGSVNHAAPMHMAESASDSQEQSLTLERLGSSTETLQLIDEALDRIEDGSFGICEGCGEEIGERRLKIKPHATLCVKCREKEEKF